MAVAAYENTVKTSLYTPPRVNVFHLAQEGGNNAALEHLLNCETAASGPYIFESDQKLGHRTMSISFPSPLPHPTLLSISVTE